MDQCNETGLYLMSADEPGKPGTPEVTDFDKNFVDLKWKPPLTDGGNPIKEYIIQKREKMK